MLARSRTLFLTCALVLTGASALVYQVAWGRMLRAVFGVGDLAVAAVLAAYFAGLGFGSLLGGRLVRRLARPALGYAALEAFVGLYALVSIAIVPLLRDAYRGVAGNASFETVSLLRLALSLVVLLPPTLAMGASMPVALAAASESERGVPARAALAYAANTLGAMAGAAAAGFWLIPTLGQRASIFAAAAGSVAAGVLVFATWRHVRVQAPTAAVAEPPEDASEQARPRLAAFLVFVGGLVSLSSEVLWTRILGLVVHGTTQAFAAMLTSFLLGIALGSALATRVLPAVRRPAIAYAVTQAGVAAGTLLAMAVTAESPRIIALASGSQDLAPSSTGVLFAIALGALLPLATAIGATVPLAWRIATGGRAPLGPAAARVLAANTLGGLTGALAAALIVIPALGIDLTSLMILGLALLSVAVAWRADVEHDVRARSLALVLPAAAYALVLLLEPSVHLPYLLRAREAPVDAVFAGPRWPEWDKPIVFLREGRNSTVTVQRLASSLQLLNDGRPESGLSIAPPGYGTELILQGTLPMLRCARIDRAAVVGLGAGHTVTTLRAGGFSRVDAIELEPAVIEAARFMHRAMGRPFPLDDPRVHTIVDDGRARLAVSPAASYDAVVSQPSHPWLAGSSALYTREFLTDVRRVLRPGGVFVLWVNRFRMDLRHLREVVATAAAVFPRLEAFGTNNDLIVVAARDARRPSAAEVERRVEAAAALRAILTTREMLPLPRIAAFAEMDDAAARRFAAGIRPITDDKPILEYELSHLSSSTVVSLAALDGALARFPWRAPPLGDPEGTVDAFLARVDATRERPRAIDRIGVELAATGLPSRQADVIAGAVAEARGDESAALEAWARTDHPEAVERRVRLLFDRGDDAAVLAVAQSARALPVGARRLAAVAAVRLRRWDRARELASTLAGELAPLGRAIVALATSTAAGPCRAVPPEAAVRVLRDDPGLLWAAATCAFEADDDAAAHAFLAAAEGASRARSVQLAERGTVLAKGGNRAGARRALSAALRWNPASGLAATALARLQADGGERAAAERTLRDALEAAHGLPRTTDQILGAAAALKIRIEGAATRADRGVTSAAGPGEVAGGSGGE